MSLVRVQPCSTCGAPLVWLRSWGFGQPTPLELEPAADGTAVVAHDEARFRIILPVEDIPKRHRYRIHWPCPSIGAVPRHPARPPHRRPLPVAVVPHTHWDREWYDAFQTYRLRLVRMIDDLLDLMEADPSVAHFTLDGQTAVVDDYLEVRPDAEARLRRLNMAGRLSIGPWHIQPDEFMVCGETLVRNLQHGLSRAGALGGAMLVGYLPDSFGHTAQLPQILRLAGISHAVVFRGVPADIASTAFWWEALDGSRVRAEFLPYGYTNGYRLSEDAKELVARTRDFEAMLGDDRAGGLLVMNGGDHQPAHPWVGQTVAEANELQDEYVFAVTGLESYLNTAPCDGLPVLRGELRASGTSTVTMGVLSNRLDVKLATAAAERAVARRAEPLSALFLPAEEFPSALLDLAWKRLVENAAHDSACGCSDDTVMAEVLNRAAEATEIGTGLAAQAVAALARRVDAPAGSLLVVNPASRARSLAVEWTARGRGAAHLVAPDGTAVPTQVLWDDNKVELAAEADASSCGWILELFGAATFSGWPVSHVEADEQEGLDVRMWIAAPGEPHVDIGEVRDRITDYVAAHPDGHVAVTLLDVEQRRVALLAPDVPAFGWSTFELGQGDGPATGLRGGRGWMANEHLTVSVDESDGTFSIETADGVHVAGLNRLVDGGDAGDTYNWSPPAVDTVVERPESVTVTALERGPVRARLHVVARYRWPANAVGRGPESHRSRDTRFVEVHVMLTLVTGERMVRVNTAFDNPCRDHRLRLHFPLPAVVTGSTADAAFAVVERGLTHEGNPVEAPLPTFPSRRWVDCSDGAVGLAVIHDGTGEYEVVDDGRELALTMIRSVGYLSVSDAKLRPVAAGPGTPLERAQLLGVVSRDYAVLLHRGSWEDAQLPALADDVLLPFEVAEVSGSDPPADHAVARRGSRLDVTGARVTAVSRDAGRISARMVRLSPSAGTIDITWDGVAARGWTIDLLGRPLAPFSGCIHVRPWEIVTIRLASS